MTGIAIRTYARADYDACRALWVELTEWHRNIYDSPHIGGDDPGADLDRHLEKHGSGRLWVAEEDGSVVGLAGLIDMEDGGGELEPLIVATSHRGHGIGRRLTEQVIAAARAEGLPNLTVRPVARNSEAIRAYHQLGFDILGYIDMFMDFVEGDRPWTDGEELAGRRFRV
jgi:GNAT superfamily N-acetyltransferase